MFLHTSIYRNGCSQIQVQARLSCNLNNFSHSTYYNTIQNAYLKMKNAVCYKLVAVIMHHAWEETLDITLHIFWTMHSNSGFMLMMKRCIMRKSTVAMWYMYKLTQVISVDVIQVLKQNPCILLYELCGKRHIIMCDIITSESNHSRRECSSSLFTTE